MKTSLKVTLYSGEIFFADCAEFQHPGVARFHSENYTTDLHVGTANSFPHEVRICATQRIKSIETAVHDSIKEAEHRAAFDAAVENQITP